MLSGFFIKQRPKYLTTLTGWETQNIYDVFYKANAAKHGLISANPFDYCQGRIFECSESSSPCERNFCPAPNREFDMIVKCFVQIGNSLLVKDFLYIHRDYKCVCCCCNRPRMSVEYIEDNAKELLGFVVSPFKCCQLIVDTVDGQTLVPKHRITGSACQCGMFFRYPCDPCKEVNF